MIKERRFNVHPNVMFCLLHLRLKTELGGVRASQTKAEKEEHTKVHSKGKASARRAKGKRTDQPHISKKALKKLKQTREIEDEMREAEAEVDREERSSRVSTIYEAFYPRFARSYRTIALKQTETLKLLFVLYFRILKSEKPTPLLPAALQGISRFAHLVNIDFFKDLLLVLRELVTNGHGDEEEPEEDGATKESDTALRPDVRAIHLRLHCIVTAFELLTGQGVSDANFVGCFIYANENFFRRGSKYRPDGFHQLLICDDIAFECHARYRVGGPWYNFFGGGQPILEVLDPTSRGYTGTYALPCA